MFNYKDLDLAFGSTISDTAKLTGILLFVQFSQSINTLPLNFILLSHFGLNETVNTTHEFSHHDIFVDIIPMPLCKSTQKKIPVFL